MKTLKDNKDILKIDFDVYTCYNYFNLQFFYLIILYYLNDSLHKLTYLVMKNYLE